MRLGLRDLGCKWLRDVTVPKIFLLRHLGVFTDPLSEAVYWQSRVINPGKHKSWAAAANSRRSFPVSGLSLSLCSPSIPPLLHLSKPTFREPQAESRAERCRGANLTRGQEFLRYQRGWIPSYMIPPAAHTQTRGSEAPRRRMVGR